MIDEGTISEIGQESSSSDPSPKATFEVGVTPFGRPAVNINDGAGNVAGYVFNSPEELGGVVGHLQALLTMLIQGMYAQRMAEQQAAHQILADGHPKDSKLWIPKN